MAETYRSMRALERTASTSRVLNLAALAVKHADNPDHIARPLFVAPALNAAVIPENIACAAMRSARSIRAIARPPR